MVTGARKGTSHELLYRETGWPTLSERRSSNKLKQLIKITNNATPAYLRNLIPSKIGETRPNSRYADDFKLPKSRTETFRRSFVPSSVKMWNDLPKHERNEDSIAKKSNTISNELYYEGSRETNVKHAQLRMECSKLNGHLYQLHVIESPACQCGHDYEDSNHYLLHCPLHNLIRHNMFQSLHTNVHINEINSSTLLFGLNRVDFKTNKSIFKAVHTFIKESNRL